MSVCLGSCTVYCEHISFRHAFTTAWENHKTNAVLALHQTWKKASGNSGSAALTQKFLSTF